MDIPRANIQVLFIPYEGEDMMGSNSLTPTMHHCNYAIMDTTDATMDHEDADAGDDDTLHADLTHSDFDALDNGGPDHN